MVFPKAKTFREGQKASLFVAVPTANGRTEGQENQDAVAQALVFSNPIPNIKPTIGRSGQAKASPSWGCTL
jgi:hypothetical protein